MFPAGTNRYGDLLRGLVEGLRDGTLSPVLLDEAQRIFNEFQDRENYYKTWLDVGGAAKFPAIRAKSGFFDVTPLETLDYIRGLAQTIPNNTETQIMGQDVNNEEVPSKFFLPRVGSKKKIDILGDGRTRLVGLMGKITWEQNSTGRRALHINYYDDADALIAGNTLHSMAPETTNDTTLPFASSFILKDYPGTQYISFTVIQTSGGDLDVQYFSAVLFLLK